MPAPKINPPRRKTLLICSKTGSLINNLSSLVKSRLQFKKYIFIPITLNSKMDPSYWHKVGEFHRKCFLDIIHY